MSMGVYIKGINMPTGCGALTLSIWPDGQVEIIDTDGNWETSYAVFVPPHGDLIEREQFDVLSWGSIPDGYENTFDDGVRWLANKIDLAPTIIPAEEGE